MKEDLNSTGNELNYYGMTCRYMLRIAKAVLNGTHRWCGVRSWTDPAHDSANEGKNVSHQLWHVVYCIDLTSAPFLLPTLQITWAIIAFCQSTITKNWHLYLLRAITGFLEASSFGGTHLIRTTPSLIQKLLLTFWKLEVGSKTKNCSSVLECGLWETRWVPCSLDISKLHYIGTWTVLLVAQDEDGCFWFVSLSFLICPTYLFYFYRGRHNSPYRIYWICILAWLTNISSALVLHQGGTHLGSQAYSYSGKRRNHMEDVQVYPEPSHVLDLRSMLCVSALTCPKIHNEPE